MTELSLQLNVWFEINEMKDATIKTQHVQYKAIKMLTPWKLQINHSSNLKSANKYLDIFYLTASQQCKETNYICSFRIIILILIYLGGNTKYFIKM